MYIPITESLNWTAQPANPTEVTKGQDVSLSWSYTLTADEQTKSDTYFKVQWTKFNPSSSSYAELFSFSITLGAAPQFSYPSDPRIVPDSASGRSSSGCKITGVKTDDEGIYKIAISVVFPGFSFVAVQEFNLTVLGK